MSMAWEPVLFFSVCLDMFEFSGLNSRFMKVYSVGISDTARLFLCG